MLQIYVQHINRGGVKNFGKSDLDYTAVWEQYLQDNFFGIDLYIIRLELVLIRHLLERPLRC